MCNFIVATGKDYDDHNEYAAHLAEILWDRLREDSWPLTSSNDIYLCIQEFNKELEDHG